MSTASAAPLSDTIDSNNSTIGQHSPGTLSSSGGTHKKNTLLDAKRLQNIGQLCISDLYQSIFPAITKRKLAMDARDIMTAVHQLDLEALSSEKVDILARILPTEEERKVYTGKEEDETLGDEDRFIAALCSIERLEHKLAVMRVLADFDESVALLEPVCFLHRN